MKSLSIIDRTGYVPCVKFGMNTLLDALRSKQIDVTYENYFTQVTPGNLVIIAGTAEDFLISKLLLEEGVSGFNKPESVVIKSCATTYGRVLVIAGSDDVGLMYALLELAQQVDANGQDVLYEIHNTVEIPDNAVRGVSRFVMSHRDDEWFYNEEFWHYYFSMMAKSRLNNFVLVVGFDTCYLSPPYTFFVEVPGYPNVYTKNLSPEQRELNLDTLKMIGKLCRQYGITFEFATWQQTPWTENQDIMIEGLAKDEEELGDFCAAGLKELLTRCTEIDIVQLRVNFEAGIGTQETNDSFWKKLIKSVADVNRDIKLNLRAKGLTDEMIKYALEQGLDLTIPTKYWCEHIALPYHMNVYRTEEMNKLHNQNHSRRYSYADFLRKPHYYDIIYRLWNYGSNSIFLWGDPDYVRRFSDSITDAQAKGYEITAPLSLKGGQMSVPGDYWPLFEDNSLVHYKFEDERYWAWYLFFGRLGYNKKTCEQVWKREFRKHFPDCADQIERAYRFGSKILPFITTFHMPVHPSLQYWTELSTGAALFSENNYNTAFGGISYGSALPSDEGLFYSIADYVQDEMEGNLKGKYTPLQSRQWLKQFADEVNKAIKDAQKLVKQDSIELKATLVDMEMLINLAYYHCEKIMAALHLCYYDNTNEENYLNQSLSYMLEAKKYWQNLCSIGEVFHNDLQFSAGHGDGIGKRGHWKDRMPEIEKDIAKLEKMGGTRLKAIKTKVSEIGMDAPDFYDNVPNTTPSNQELKVFVKISELHILPDGIKMHYRHMNHLEGYFNEVSMSKVNGGYIGIIPKEYVTYEWDLMIYFTAIGVQNQTLLYPGIYNARYSAPYYIVKTVK